MHGSCVMGNNLHEAAQIDHFDLKLLAALQDDGRLTNAELGERIGLSASQCSRRRVRLEESGIIEAYHARLDARRLGLGVIALVQVTLGTHSNDNAKKFAAFIDQVAEVQEAYAVTGDADYLLKVVVPGLPELAKIISETILAHPTVSHVKSSIVLMTLKDTHRLPLAIKA
jgi:DNA-binding Lrp family transcriptional regulator